MHYPRKHLCILVLAHLWYLIYIKKKHTLLIAISNSAIWDEFGEHKSIKSTISNA